MLPAQLSISFQSLPPIATSKLGPSGADSQVGVLVYILEPCGSLQLLSCEVGSFSNHCNHRRSFKSEVLRLYFPMLEPWVAWSRSPHTNVGPPTRPPVAALPGVPSCQSA